MYYSNEWTPMPPPTAPREEDTLREINNIGLGEHTAKVAVILDISYSMDKFFEDRSVHKLLKKAASIAASFDDDGDLDVFTFGQRGRYRGAVKPNNIDSFVDKMTEKDGGLDYFLESQTNYGAGIKSAKDFFFPESSGRPEHPVFAMFVTDGDCTPNKKESTIKEFVDASKKPMFIKILAVGLQRNETEFVQQLDDLEGRKIDNTDTVFSPDFDVSIKDMLHEYRGFVKEAKEKRMFTSDPKIDFRGLSHEGRIQEQNQAECCVIS